MYYNVKRFAFTVYFAMWNTLALVSIMTSDTPAMRYYKA